MPNLVCRAGGRVPCPDQFLRSARSFRDSKFAQLGLTGTGLEAADESGPVGLGTAASFAWHVHARVHAHVSTHVCAHVDTHRGAGSAGIRGASKVTKFTSGLPVLLTKPTAGRLVGATRGLELQVVDESNLVVWDGDEFHSQSCTSSFDKLLRAVDVPSLAFYFAGPSIESSGWASWSVHRTLHRTFH